MSCWLLLYLINELCCVIGVVKVTPAHDPKDFECGLRHNLPEKEIIDKEGRICGAVDARFLGMDRYDAREHVVEELKAMDLYVDKVKSFSDAGNIVLFSV